MERVAVILGKMNRGGVERVVMEYYAHLDHTRYQYDFYLQEGSARIPQIEISRFGGRVFLLPKITKLFKYQKMLYKYLKDGNYNVMHVNLTTLAFFALRVGYKANIPVRISHSHTTSNRREGLKFFIKQLLRPLSNLYVTDRFACSNHAGKWLFGKRQVKKGNVTLINNGVDVESFKFDKKVREETRKRLGLEKNYVIGNIGRLVSQKNQKFLIDVFYLCQQQTANARLVIVGEGELEHKLKRRVEKLKIEDKVLFLGPRSDIPKLMQAFDCFALPSIYEGLVIVGVEAQASGLPCVCSKNVAPETKLSDSMCFVSIRNKTEWVNRLLNPPITERENAYKTIRDNGYDIYLCADKLMERYDNLRIRPKNHVVEKVYTELISVLVPIFEVKKYLIQCIDSILNQSYKNIEIILVDDGSHDGSAQICDEYLKDARVKVIHQTNKGLAETRNIAIKHATGEYIVFVDGDDFVSPYYVENLYYALTSSGATMSCCNFVKYKDGDVVELAKYTEDINVLSIEDYVGSVLYQELECNAWGKLYRKETAKSLVYEKNMLYEDVGVLPQLFSKLETIAVVNSADYMYRSRPNSILNKQFSAKHMDCLTQMKFLKEYILENYPLYESGMDCRYFSAVCALFLRVDKRSFPKIYQYLWQEIKKYRVVAIADSRARRKTQYAGIISRFGGKTLKTVSKFVGVL